MMPAAKMSVEVESGRAICRVKSRKKKGGWPSGNILDLAFNSSVPPVNKAPCELCGGVYPQPITYHMRQVHFINMSINILLKIVKPAAAMQLPDCFERKMY